MTPETPQTPEEAMALMDEMCSGCCTSARATEIQNLLRAAGSAYPTGDYGLMEDMLKTRVKNVPSENWRK